MSEFDRKSKNSVSDEIGINISGLNLGGAIGKPLCGFAICVAKIFADMETRLEEK